MVLAASSRLVTAALTAGLPSCDLTWMDVGNASAEVDASPKATSAWPNIEDCESFTWSLRALITVIRHYESLVNCVQAALDRREVGVSRSGAGKRGRWRSVHEGATKPPKRQSAKLDVI